MNTDQILNTFDPLLSAALERLSKFSKPEPKDVQRFFGPCFEAIGRAANLEPAVLTDWLATQGPDTISRESIHAFIRSLTESPAVELEAARARQEQIAREISAKPLTARELVILERGKPLAERSRDSILAELFEARSGCIRGAVDGRCAERGAKLPDIVWATLQEREPALQAELDARDCRIHGVEYSPASDKQARPDLAYIPAMRG